MKKYIEDFARKALASAIKSHVRRHDSVLIVGEYGTGKTDALKQVRVAGSVRVSPLGGAYQVLSRMCGSPSANPRHKDNYMDTLIERPRTIIIDEAQHLPKDVFPYLKIIMDAGNPLILAGLPELQSMLKKYHADVLSRLTTIKIGVLSYEDFLTLVPDFDPDDFSIIYNSMSNMRAMMTAVKNCRDYAEENNIKLIDYKVIELFVDGGE